MPGFALIKIEFLFEPRDFFGLAVNDALFLQTTVTAVDSIILSFRLLITHIWRERADQPRFSNFSLRHYLWLRRNDFDWLEENLPSVTRVPWKKPHLDWGKTDRELCEKVKQAVLEIGNAAHPLIRVCITEIIRRVGYKKWIDKRTAKLPLTAKLIEEEIESLEDFMLRKIQYTKSLYLKENKLPTTNQFRLRAIVFNKTSVNSQRVQAEIDQAMVYLRANWFKE